MPDPKPEPVVDKAALDEAVRDMFAAPPEEVDAAVCEQADPSSDIV